MAMVIMNNGAAMQALKETNKNSNKLSKDLQKVASGMKINGAGDGAAEYAISERMRAKVRGLNQDIQNIQNGTALLGVASGGIQSIVEELRTLKELAINSANDHNNTLDRAALQEEFNQRKANIEDIAVETNYNGIPLLDGRWCQMLWEDGISEPEIISQDTSTKTTTGNVTTTTVGPQTSIRTIPSTMHTTKSSTTITSETPPSSTGITTVGPIAGTPVVTTTSSTNGPAMAVSNATTSSSSVSTRNGNQTTVKDTDITVINKTETTSYTTTTTSTVQNVTTTTFVSCQEITSTQTEEPILITNGTTSISANGIYRFAPDYTGTLTITAPTVEIMGPEDGTILNDVYIVDNGLEDLYLKDVSIVNKSGKDKPTIKFDSSASNTLHLLGVNNISEDGIYTDLPETEWGTYGPGKVSACINVGGGLSVVGNGSLAIKSTYHNGGAIIGSDDGNWSNYITGTDFNSNCGNIVLGQGITLEIEVKANSGGAGIGSGGGGASCGDILIGSYANITVKEYNSAESDSNPRNHNPAAAIGAGQHGGYPYEDYRSSCGDIIIYSNANVTAYAQRGTGIGCGANVSSCGNITIYSGAVVDANSQSIEGSAAIGSGNGGIDPSNIYLRYPSDCGNITIYSYSSGDVTARAASPTAQAIGQGKIGSEYATVGNVSLLDTDMYQEGGIADYSELTLGVTTTTEYEITTDTITNTETTGTITETTTTQYDTWTETTETVSTTVYEDGEPFHRLRLNEPLIIHTGTKANEHLRVYIENMRLNALGIEDTKIDPLEAAVSSLEVIDKAIEYALDNAVKVGAYSSRLEFTNDNLVVSQEAATSSESVIRDADMAKEMMSYTKESILAQASQAILSQANQNLSSVLTLLR